MSTNSKDFDLFFSYNHESAGEKVTLLYDKLKDHYNKSIRIWIDKKELVAGKTLESQLMNGLKKTKCVVCFITEKYSKSENCLRELSFAMSMTNKPIIVMLEHFDKCADDVQFKIINAARLNFYKNNEANLWSGDYYDQLIKSVDFYVTKPDENRIKSGLNKSKLELENRPNSSLNKLKMEPLSKKITTIKTLEGHKKAINCLVHFNNDLLASSALDKSIRIWDLKTGNTIRALRGHTDDVKCLAVLNENTLISGSWDKTIKIWNITNGSVINTLNGHEGYIQYIVLLNQDLLASACGTGTRIDDPSIHIWNLKTGEINLSLVGYGPLANFSSASSSINECYLIASSTDKTIQIWNYSNGNLIRTLDGHKYGMGAIAVLSESLIATASGNEIRIWNVDNEFSIKTMKTAENDDVSINSLIVLKNGLLVSCGHFSFKINVWNTTSGSLVHTLEEHSQVPSRTMGVIALDVLENGSLVSGASDYLIKIWNEIP